MPVITAPKPVNGNGGCVPPWLTTSQPAVPKPANGKPEGSSNGYDS